MSDCGVCIGSEDYDCVAEFHEVKVVKARKEHRCCECSAAIPVGSQYEYISAKADGDFFFVKTCLPCAEIRSAFTCGALNYGEFWQEMRDCGFEQVTTGCLAKLESPAAKQMLLDRWNKWKGL